MRICGSGGTPSAKAMAGSATRQPKTARQPRIRFRLNISESLHRTVYRTELQRLRSHGIVPMPDSDVYRMLSDRTTEVKYCEGSRVLGLCHYESTWCWKNRSKAALFFSESFPDNCSI